MQKGILRAIKILAFILFVLLIIFSRYIINSCEQGDNKFYAINQSERFYLTLANVTCDDIVAEEIDNEKILIVATITIEPKRKLSVIDKDFLLEVQEKSDDPYKPDVEYNIAKNGYNVYENMLTEKTTYKFCYAVEKPNMDEYQVYLLLFDKFRLIETLANENVG